MTWVPLTLWRAAALERWKRLVRWLARNEIGQAYEAGSALAQTIAQQQSQLLQQMAYSHGENAGRQQMHDAVLAAVYERMGGGVDAWVMPEDLKRAMRGLLH